MNKLINKLNEGIETCETRKEDLDGSSFDSLEGVVISANEAKMIINWLKILRAIMKWLSKANL